ncbi:transcriptional regulator [Planococcus lenghuensis]|uniref:Transcriptional regulator n=2 Tax=Planococcus lenghuensis TaxID=2213202 RepID=A0A1Q2KY88_9BACL|nr:transcriptional regulator [Planococcus lenghuensis]
MKEIMNGSQLLQTLEALSNPYRLKIIAILHAERQYVSQLSRELGISRPLLYLHLQKLEEAGLINGYHEVSDTGKSMKYYELEPFDLQLTGEVIEKHRDSLPAKRKE